jgi:hypothetical protein
VDRERNVMEMDVNVQKPSIELVWFGAFLVMGGVNVVERK